MLGVRDSVFNFSVLACSVWQVVIPTKKLVSSVTIHRRVNYGYKSITYENHDHSRSSGYDSTSLHQSLSYSWAATHSSYTPGCAAFNRDLSFRKSVHRTTIRKVPVR